MSNIKKIAGIALLVFLGYEVVWQWMFCRVYVGPGEILVLTAKMGKENPDPENKRVVDEGFKGVQRVALGEGRYFYNPFTYDRRVIDRGEKEGLVEIDPKQVGIVTANSGAQPKSGEFLVDDMDHKGVWRKVLTPGAWRYNPLAYSVQIAPATEVKPGYVGCVTHLIGTEPPNGKLAGKDESGIMERVLQPGIYYLNPREYRVEPVMIGYEEQEQKGISFPSNDGFQIQMDVSVVWGLEPSDVPHVMQRFGNESEVLDKVIKPQVESICRNEGSGYPAKAFIEGTSREEFQKAFTKALTTECESRHIRIVTGLVRDIQVPETLRQPIQQAKVAVEERLTKVEQQTTQEIVNQLSETKADVEKGVRETDAGTQKIIAETRADGEKQVAEIKADQTVAVAEIEKQIAEIEAQRTRILGEATAKAEQLKKEAEANRLKQNVDAIGGARAYSDYIFAMGLPETFQVFIRYAGPGTFWTDLPSGAKVLEDAANMKILDKDGAQPAPKAQK